jgi:hypothetical protein
MYYLQASGSGSREVQPANPLSKLLAETFEEKKSKKGRVRRMKQQHINPTEQLPAGAIDADSDEDAPVSHSQRERGQHKAHRPRRAETDDSGLDAVDLTTPLRDDEIYVVLKHREVPTERNSLGHTKVVEDINDKKKKKKSKSKSAATKTTGDLLDDMDELPDRGGKSTSSSRHKAKTHATDDLLGLAISAPTPAHSIAAPVMAGGGQAQLSARNKITDSFRGLGLDDDDYSDDPNSMNAPKLAIQQLNQPTQSISSSGSVFGFTLASLRPHVMNQDQFADLLGSAGRHWMTASVRVSYRSKTRTATKTLATLLNAHTIESESSRASSLCSRSSTGDYVCCLLKYKKDVGEVAVDIKCSVDGINNNKLAAQGILKTVVDAITVLPL